MKNRIKNWLARELAKRGRRITRYPLAQYLRDKQIDCVLDVGANIGQYALELRELGYRGRIVSFEPMPAAFEKLTQASEHDPLWLVENIALGSETGRLPLSIIANSPSSSFLEVDPRVSVGTVDLSVVGSVEVPIQPLDKIFASAIDGCQHIHLKIDTQGFERQVIQGALDSLASISLVQMELALVRNYVGETLAEDMIALMRHHDFEPWWTLDGYRNPVTLQLFQIDVFFSQCTRK